MVVVDGLEGWNPVRFRTHDKPLEVISMRGIVAIVVFSMGVIVGNAARSDDDLLAFGDTDTSNASSLIEADSDEDLLGGNLLEDEEDPLDGIRKNQPKPLEKKPAKETDPHQELWTEGCYPSAETCKKCHPKHYDEWSVSAHAYAMVSPMYTRFEQAMTEYTKGTVGTFCIRCHSPVGIQLEVPRTTSWLELPPVVREGITCIACHRVREHFWRGTNGDRRIEAGDIHQAVGGTSNGEGLTSALAQSAKLKLHSSPHQTGPGQKIHSSSYFFEPLTNSDICVSCHQVAVHPGIALEVVHAQYRSGPAAKKGINCQDCHMGAVPGKPLGYECGHAAVINEKPFGQPRRHGNHTFWGPNNSIAHPGVFPHNAKAGRYTPRQWLSFDYEAGWGTKEFEDNVPSGITFPHPWDTTDDRRDARKVIDENLAKLRNKRASSILTMEAGLDVEGPFFYGTPQVGQDLKVGYRVTNISEGHNAPTGSLGAQPQVWINAVLIDPLGRRVWESGYLDRNADLADMHSREVAKGYIPRDRDLFNLQTKFLINNVRGTDREAAAPLNFSVDQLVFLRPGAVPVSVLNHPPLIRMEAHSIAPLDHRVPKYHIPASAFRIPGPYRLSVRMRARGEPIYFMRQIHSTPEMIRKMNENILDFRMSSKTFLVK